MAITRWDPMDSLMPLPLRDVMSRLFEESFVPPRGLELFAVGRGFPVDIYETANDYVIEASMPGMKVDEIQVTTVGDTLTIRAKTAHEQEQKEEKEKEKGDYVRRERYSGEVTRTIELPSLIDADKVEATYKHGILTLHVPKAEEVKPKAIPVQAQS
jgi:HSP20 family protein